MNKTQFHVLTLFLIAIFQAILSISLQEHPSYYTNTAYSAFKEATAALQNYHAGFEYIGKGKDLKI